MERKKIRFRLIEAHQDVKETLHLPQEIIGEILARLPVKSLLRFKCVSKQWCLVISSNWFIKAHLDKSSEDKSSEHHRIIFERSIVQAKQCFLPSFLYEPLATALNFDLPMCGPQDLAYVFGSCNGLVCILKRFAEFILWNPSTRKFRKLPYLFDGIEPKNKSLDAYGFGFHESNNDYKVFCKWHDYVTRERSAAIYSLKSDSWRTVDDRAVVDCGFRSSVGVYSSGKLHWIAFGPNDRSEIVSFDLENETFGTVEWPRGCGVASWGTLSNTINGCLCLFSRSRSDHDYFDYWRLKEYDRAKDDSWFKFGTRLSEYFRPLFEGPGGEILGWIYGPYAIFSKGGGRVFTPKRVSNLETGHPAITYVESLVSPVGPTKDR